LDRVLSEPVIDNHPSLSGAAIPSRNIVRLCAASAMKIFEERIRRQVRRGGRMAFIADVAVPEAPGRRVAVLAPHLEDYCPPSYRHSQMDYLLD
jgi:hypothetical protein